MCSSFQSTFFLHMIELVSTRWSEWLRGMALSRGGTRASRDTTGGPHDQSTAEMEGWICVAQGASDPDTGNVARRASRGCRHLGKRNGKRGRDYLGRLPCRYRAGGRTGPGRSPAATWRSATRSRAVAVRSCKYDKYNGMNESCKRSTNM